MKELLQAKRKNLELVKVQFLLEKYNIAPSTEFKIPTSPLSYLKSCNIKFQEYLSSSITNSRVLKGKLTFWRYSQACKKRPSCENPIYSEPVIYRLEQKYLASFSLFW